MTDPRTALSLGVAAAAAGAVLLSAGTAYADPPSSSPGQAKKESSSGTAGSSAPAEQKAPGQEKKSEASQSSSTSAPGQAKKDSSPSADAPGPVKKDTSPSATAPGQAKKDNAGAAGNGQAKDSGTKKDPRGNNGTIKIDGAPFDSSHGEESHVSCGFRLNFWGFDNGQLADVTFQGWSPTRTGTLLSLNHVLISNTPAGGGNDFENLHVPSTGAITADTLGLSGVAPHKQGYHVRVDVKAFNADGSTVPGGSKTKVFWLEPCAPTPVIPVTPTTPATPGIPVTPAIPATPVTPVTPFTPVTPRVPAGPSIVTAPQVGGIVEIFDRAPLTPAGAGTPVGFAAPRVLARTVSSNPTTVGGARFSAPQALPFTGGNHLAELLTSAIATLGGGVLLRTVAGRRRRTA